MIKKRLKQLSVMAAMQENTTGKEAFPYQSVK